MGKQSSKFGWLGTRSTNDSARQSLAKMNANQRTACCFLGAVFLTIIPFLFAASTLDEPLKIHPKVFNMIDCWISDSESPVITEINLDAVEKNGNQFNTDEVKPDGEWTRCPTPESKEGFMRYRVLESKGRHYKVEYQENGGGTLTTASIIEFDIQKRN